MRGCARALLTLAATTIVACGGGKNPTNPTPPSTAPVSAVMVTAGSTSGPTFQLTATARMADGSTQNVTTAATWISSNPLVAVVSAGTVTVVGSGELDVQATYQSVSGSLHLLVTRVPVVSISITGGAPSGNFQLTATARLSDGTVQDVTRSATWVSSNSQIATVSSTGFATIVANGEVDLRATYQGVTGAQRFTVALSRTLAVTGTVREVAPNVRAVPNAIVRILGGSIPAVATDDQGAFRFSAVGQGRVLIEISKEGYVVWEGDETVAAADLALTVNLYPTPPKNADGAGATARCGDGTWSWAQSRADACTANGGVAYFVCPGPICVAATPSR